jgi:hypothetical protein
LEAEELGKLLGLFEKLKIIHLPAKDEEEQGAYVRSLASRCRALEEVSFRSTLALGVLQLVVWEVFGHGLICRRVVE